MRALVTLRTAEGTLAVDVGAARAVLPAGELRALPSPAPQVAGLAEHQGAAVPVLAAFGPGAHVLVLEDAGRRFGLLVEEVLRVVRVREDEVAPPPAGQDERLVAGLLRRDGEQVLVLDAAVLRARLG